jgi:hypothetical protein
MLSSTSRKISTTSVNFHDASHGGNSTKIEFRKEGKNKFVLWIYRKPSSARAHVPSSVICIIKSAASSSSISACSDLNPRKVHVVLPNPFFTLLDVDFEFIKVSVFIAPRVFSFSFYD